MQVVDALLSRLPSEEQHVSFISSIVNDIEQTPSVERLSEATLVVGFLNKENIQQYSVEHVDAIRNALIRLILNLISDSGAEQPPIISLVRTNDAVRQRVLHLLINSLATYAVSKSPDRDEVLLGDFQELKINSLAETIVPDNLESIRFLIAYYRVTRGDDQSQNGSLLLIALRLIEHADKKLSALALQLAVAVIDCFSASAPPDSTSIEKLWSVVLSFVDHRQHPGLVTSGLTLWLRLLSRIPSELPLLLNEYWDVLCASLSRGSSEQQKVSLAIFRVSIALQFKCQSEATASPTQVQQDLTRYERFMTVYQTIILDRYLNQVHETLADLTLVARPGYGVPSRWLFALLTTALSTSAQFSVRRVIGGWVLLNKHIFVDPLNTETHDLLEHVFLPWAATGVFYISSVQRDDKGSIVCGHGEQVADLVATVLVDARDDTRTRLHLKAILRFLHSQGRRIFSHGRAFILEGLERALEAKSIVFDDDEHRLLTDITNTGGFEEAVTDYMTVLCLSILEKGREPGSTSRLPQDAIDRAHVIHSEAGVERQSDFAATMSLASKSPVTLEDDEVYSIGWLFKKITETRHRCLTGSGLIAGIRLLQELLDAVEGGTELDDEAESGILMAFRDSLEVQDWPRTPLMDFIKVLLCTRLVKAHRVCPQTHKTSVEIVEELLPIAQGKVYVFSTFAVSWRALVRICPNDALRLPLIKFIKAFALEPPEAKSEFELEAVVAGKLAVRAPRRTYESYYGHGESYAYACVFDMLNNLPKSELYVEELKGLLGQLMEPWPRQKLPLTTFSAWKSTTQINVMFLLLEHLFPFFDETEIERYYRDVMRVLEIELLPRYRFLFEWMAARIMLQSPSHRQDMLARLQDQDLSNPKMAISVVKLCHMVALFPDAPEPYARELAVCLALLTACPKIAVRHEAQWTFPQLWTLAQRRRWSGITTDEVFARMDGLIRGMDAYKEPPQGRMLENMDAVADHNLCNLLEGFYLDVEPREDAKVHQRDFLAVWADDDDGDEHDGGVVPLGQRREYRAPKADNNNNTTTADTDVEAKPVPLQTKGRISLDEPAKIPLSLLDAGAPHGTPARARASPLIVVASLVESHWNLGGMCRAAEILGAARLCVHSRRVVASAAFTTTSVSSQLHLEVEQVPAAEVSSFLTGKKAEGYEVVGIEQTDRSRVLGSGVGARFKADGRTVLVVGKESTGLPGGLLADCDWCVEIRQKGVTRSMNVQTAAAVVMYEYVRQREERPLQE